MAALANPPAPGSAFFCGRLESVIAMTSTADAPENDITFLLASCREGDSAAEAKLLEIVYHELRNIARYHMRRESAGLTLQPTALVNETYTRLFGSKIDWQNRAQFFSVAALTMRRILVDHARTRRARKRFGGQGSISMRFLWRRTISSKTYSPWTKRWNASQRRNRVKPSWWS